MSTLTVLALALAGVLVGLLTGMILLARGESTERRPGYITDHPRRRPRRTPPRAIAHTSRCICPDPDAVRGDCPVHSAAAGELLRHQLARPSSAGAVTLQERIRPDYSHDAGDDAA